MNFGGGVPGLPAAVAPTGLSQPARYIISGQTLDPSNAPLADCTVEIYETVSGMFRASALSDDGGNYSADVSGPDATDAGGNALTFFAVAYSADGTQAGVTVNTLLGTPS